MRRLKAAGRWWLRFAAVGLRQMWQDTRQVGTTGNARRATIRWELQQRELAARDSAGDGGAAGKPTRRKADIVRYWWCFGVVPFAMSSL